MKTGNKSEAYENPQEFSYITTKVTKPSRGGLEVERSLCIQLKAVTLVQRYDLLNAYLIRKLLQLERSLK